MTKKKTAANKIVIPYTPRPLQKEFHLNARRWNVAVCHRRFGKTVMAVKLNAQVKEIQKDLDNIEKRDTYVETVKLRAEVDQLRSQVSALWDYTNKLRDKFNGH